MVSYIGLAFSLFVIAYGIVEIIKINKAEKQDKSN